MLIQLLFHNSNSHVKFVIGLVLIQVIFVPGNSHFKWKTWFQVLCGFKGIIFMAISTVLIRLVRIASNSHFGIQIWPSRQIMPLSIYLYFVEIIAIILNFSWGLDWAKRLLCTGVRWGVAGERTKSCSLECFDFSFLEFLYRCYRM